MVRDLTRFESDKYNLIILISYDKKGSKQSLSRIKFIACSSLNHVATAYNFLSRPYFGLCLHLCDLSANFWTAKESLRVYRLVGGLR